MAMACLLLASKIEEAPRRPRDVINVVHRLKQRHRNAHNRQHQKKPVPLLLDQHYINIKNQVIKAERRLLNVLGFVVHVKHPHKLIYAYVQALRCTDNMQLIQKAWSYMNDGLRTEIFMRYRPETIACACIFLAARTVTPPVPLPQEPFPWFELFDASDREVQDIAMVLVKLYTRTKSTSWYKLEKKVAELRERIPGLVPGSKGGGGVSKFESPDKTVKDGGDSTKNRDSREDRKRAISPPSRDRRYVNGKAGSDRKYSRSKSRSKSRSPLDRRRNKRKYRKERGGRSPLEIRPVERDGFKRTLSKSKLDRRDDRRDRHAGSGRRSPLPPPLIIRDRDRDRRRGRSRSSSREAADSGGKQKEKATDRKQKEVRDLLFDTKKRKRDSSSSPEVRSRKHK